MPESGPSAISRNDVLLLGVTALAVIGLYAPTLYGIGIICWNDDDYSHGLLLPFIVGYFLWERRAAILEKIRRHPPHGISLVGVALLLSGCLLLAMGITVNTLYIKWLSFFPVVAGILVLLLGLRPGLAIFGTFSLLFMAKPLPDALVPRLFGPFQAFAAKVSAWTLEALDVPVYLVGNIIEIPHMKLLVEEACSGMRSLMALLTVALIVLHLIAIPRLLAPVLIAISVLVALTLNVIRVAATGLLAHFYDPDAATGFFHTFTGMIVFFVGLVILYSIASWFQKLSTRSP